MSLFKPGQLLIRTDGGDYTTDGKPVYVTDVVAVLEIKFRNGEDIIVDMLVYNLSHSNLCHIFYVDRKNWQIIFEPT